MSVRTPGAAPPSPSTAVPAAAPSKKKRGRESALDMVRSLGLILVIIIPVWFLAQPPSSDKATIRVVDPRPDITSFLAAVPGIPVPGTLPSGWRATSSTLEPGNLRIGWVTPSDQYAEYAASTRPPAEFLPDIATAAAQVGTFQIGAVTWQQYRDGDEHTSLVRQVPSGTVVIGGLRETTTLEELRVLAAAVG